MLAAAANLPAMSRPDDGQLLAVRRDGIRVIPAELVANGTVLKHLPGVLTLLRDTGYNDEEALRWLYEPDAALDGNAATGLGGHRAREVKRRAQALAFLKYEASAPYNELVNHQADALAPVIRFCETPQYLHDPDYPQEDFNAVWRDVMRYAVPDQVSHYINGQRAQRILDKQLDLVKNNQKSAAAALTSAARQINAEIRATVAAGEVRSPGSEVRGPKSPTPDFGPRTAGAIP